jgi:hypothetical protein
VNATTLDSSTGFFCVGMDGERLGHYGRRSQSCLKCMRDLVVAFFDIEECFESAMVHGYSEVGRKLAEIN